MPLIYGTNSNNYIPLDPSRVSTRTQFKTKSGFSFLSILKGLIIVGEIAASIFLGPVGTLAVGTAGAAAITGLDLAQGQFSALNTLINFSGVALGGAAALRAGKGFRKAATTGIKALTEETSEKIFKTATNKALSRSAKIRQTQRINNLNKRLRDLDKLTKELEASSVFTTQRTFLSKIKKIELEATKSFSGKGARTLLSQEEFLTTIINKGKTTRVLTKAEVDFIKQTKVQARQIEKVFKGDQLKFYKQILDPRTRPGDLRKLIKAFRRTITQEQAVEVAKTTKNFKEFLKYGSRPLTLKQPAFKRFIKFAGTSEYNDRVVQMAQNIDANDLGRYPVERAYQYLKKKLTKATDKIIRNKAVKKAIKKGAKYATKAEKAWVKAGGVWLGGAFISGYKVIDATKGIRTQAVLIRFNKENTAAINKEWKGKPTNNFGGKKDVIITASNKDLKNLRELGGDYYLDRWARNKGGQRTGIFKRAGAIPISDKLSLFLGFVPNNALRLNLSIVSNLTENIYDLATNRWHKEWSKKFVRSFSRSIINRSARLLTRVGLPAIGVNKRVSREISRFTAAGITSFYTTKNGNLSFRKPGKNTLGRTFSLAGIAGTRSALLRKARSKGNVAITRNLGGVRQLNQGLRRIPGAVTPNKTFNSRSLLKFKF